MIKMRFLEEEVAEKPLEKKQQLWKGGPFVQPGFHFPPPPPFAGNGPVPSFGIPMAPMPFHFPPVPPQNMAPPLSLFGNPNKNVEEKEEDPRFKITKKCFRMSEIFGGEPKAYEEFVTKNLDLKVDDLSQLYVTMNEKVSISKETNSKIQEKAKKLSFYFGKPAENFIDLVSKNPASNFRQLISLAK